MNINADRFFANVLVTRRSIDTASHPYAVMVFTPDNRHVVTEFVQSFSSAKNAEKRLSRVHGTRGRRVSVQQVGAAARG